MLLFRIYMILLANIVSQGSPYGKACEFSSTVLCMN